MSEEAIERVLDILYPVLVSVERNAERGFGVSEVAECMRALAILRAIKKGAYYGGERTSRT